MFAMPEKMRDYLIHRITGERAAAEVVWNELSEDIRDKLSTKGYGMNGYTGSTVSAPIGSTWKAHRQLVERVEAIVDKICNEVL